MDDGITCFEYILIDLKHMFSCEICAVSLQTQDGNWLVHAQHGWLGQSWLGLKESKLFKVCVRRNMQLIVPDTVDASFLRKDPLVEGDPKIRFYAEMPFNGTDGTIAGSLILADRRPLEELQRQGMDLDEAKLAELGLQASRLLEQMPEQAVTPPKLGKSDALALPPSCSWTDSTDSFAARSEEETPLEENEDSWS
eukprot:TRINITY_DN95191_c0_g1_i1.p1 TRINITY_DN95191_c0_g1~~TRINITY_DN95191_c0_g1_i1.p1  ORF type:complete len:206 (-),score=33.14 TRINITY_DN95191_c0_g1_i1:142-729(-)